MSLSDDMRAAADTLERFSVKMGYTHPQAVNWNPAHLRTEADHVEAEEREAIELEQMVMQLKVDLFNAGMQSNAARTLAEKLIEDGWRKE